MARWLYDHAAAMGMPVAKFNAAYLHETHARNVRTAQLGAGAGAGGEKDDDGDDGGGGGGDGGFGSGSGDEEDGEVDEGVVTQRAAAAAAAAVLAAVRGAAGADNFAGHPDVLAAVAEAGAAAEVGVGAVEHHLGSGHGEAVAIRRKSKAEHPLSSSGRRSAQMLRHYSVGLAGDPMTNHLDLAWAALTRGDCAYHGPARPGGCGGGPHSHRRALREYRSAAAAARRAVQGGEDADVLLAQALYSEAWMRAHGEGCKVDRPRARAALYEGLEVGSRAETARRVIGCHVAQETGIQYACS